MEKDDFYIGENVKLLHEAVKEIGAGQDKGYEFLDENLNAMELTQDQRRELINRIMSEAWGVARKEAPYCGNIFDDTDEADEVMEKRFQIVVRKMLELKKKYGLPIAKYDHETKRAYIEYADCHREYLD